MSGERETVEKLQSLLSAERQKEFQAHVSGQEKETEIQHLRQQLSRLEADRLSLSEQLRTLRSEVKLKGEEIQRLKSELASERFQREHAKQQLLMNQRAQLTLTTTRGLTQSPQGREKTPPTTTTPTEPSGAATSQKHEKERGEGEGGDMFSHERESVASHSARMLPALSLRIARFICYAILSLQVSLVSCYRPHPPPIVLTINLLRIFVLCRVIPPCIYVRCFFFNIIFTTVRIIR